MKTGKTYTNDEIAAAIDHTLLKPTATVDDIRKLCREARKYHFASVCVNPCHVEFAKQRLKGSDVKVCTVIGFPLGQNTPMAKAIEAVDALERGADELDFVLNVGCFKEAGDFSEMVWKSVLDEISGAWNAKFTTKLIIECCYLTDEEKVAACMMAKRVGFDFVKTSTGFGSGGATVDDVRLMRRTVGRKTGVKAAGGIRTREQAVAMLEAGATRLGCSASVAIMKEK